MSAGSKIVGYLTNLFAGALIGWSAVTTDSTALAICDWFYIGLYVISIVVLAIALIIVLDNQDRLR